MNFEKFVYNNKNKAGMRIASCTQLAELTPGDRVRLSDLDLEAGPSYNERVKQSQRVKQQM